MNPRSFYAKVTREAAEAGGGGLGSSVLAAAPQTALGSSVLAGSPGFTPAPAAAPAAPETPAAPTPPVAAPDYSWAADYVKDGALDVDSFRPHYEALATAKAEADARAAAVPEAYDFAVPADLDLGDLKLPEGVTLEIKRDDPTFAPLFDEMGGVLKELGAPADAAGKVMGLLAKHEAARYRQAYDAANKELETLGPTQAARDARLEPIKRALETKLPAAEAKALMGAVASAAGVKALERLLSPGGVQAPSPASPPVASDPLARRFPNR